MAQVPSSLDFSVATNIGEFPFHPFGNNYNFDEKNKEHLPYVLKSITKPYISNFVFGCDIFSEDLVTLREIKLYSVNSANQEFNQEIRKKTLHRAILLNFVHKIYEQPIGNYVFIAIQKDAIKYDFYCTICHDNVGDDPVKHLVTCLPKFDARIAGTVCASCDEKLSVEYDPQIHSCSQSHYNSHFASLVMADNTRICKASSLQSGFVLAPNFYAIIQLVLKKQYYTTREISNNWLHYFSKYKHNLSKETFDPQITLRSYFDTYSDLGAFVISCDHCSSIVTKMSGSSINDLLSTLAERQNITFTQSYCGCGQNAIYYNEVVHELLTTFFEGEIPANITEQMEQTPQQIQIVKKKNQNEIAGNIKSITNLLLQQNVFGTGDDMSLEDFDLTVKSLNTFPAMALSSVAARVFRHSDFDILFFNKKNSTNVEASKLLMTKLCAVSPEINDHYQKCVAKLSEIQPVPTENNSLTTSRSAQHEDQIAARRYQIMLNNAVKIITEEQMLEISPAQEGENHFKRKKT